MTNYPNHNPQNVPPYGYPRNQGYGGNPQQNQLPGQAQAHPFNQPYPPYQAFPQDHGPQGYPQAQMSAGHPQAPGSYLDRNDTAEVRMAKKLRIRKWAALAFAGVILIVVLLFPSLFDPPEDKGLTPRMVNSVFEY